MTTPNAGPWTRHGHAVPGITRGASQAFADRCGGPGVCHGCTIDADRMLADGAGDPR